MIGPIQNAKAPGRLFQARRCVCVAGLALLLVLSAQAQFKNESSVKVAYVYNLTKFVEWPSTANTLCIAVVGDGGMGESLKGMLAGKSIDSRPITVVLSPGDDALARCQILYVDYRSRKKIKSVLEKVQNAGVLTVGDDESFAIDGGMIGLVTSGEHVQIQVNLQAVQNGRLKLSSRLLGLATVVRSGGKN